MEIRRLDMISDFVSPLPKVPNHMYNNFLKWFAIILALIATLTSIFTRIKLLIIRIRSIKRAASSKHLLHLLDDDFDFTDEDDDTSSSSPPESDDDDSIGQTKNQFDQDFSVAGGSNCGPQLFSWSDFAAGKSVVKLWDSLGVIQDSFFYEDSLWGLDNDREDSSFSRGHHVPASEMSSPAVVYLATETSDSDGVKFGAYDRRIGTKNPAVYAEWRQPMGKVVGVGSGGVDKVYVKGGGGGGGAALTVGDLRNVRTPLDSLTDADVDTFWDVIDDAEF